VRKPGQFTHANPAAARNSRQRIAFLHVAATIITQYAICRYRARLFVAL
jgi:hypothetical protein